jgi:site-specific DNA-cytosine methylase
MRTVPETVGALTDGAHKWPAEVASTMNARFADKQGLEDQHALSGASYFVPATIGTLTARMMNALGTRDVEEGAVMPVAFAQNQRDEVRTMDKAGALAAEPGAKQQTYVAFGLPGNWIGRKSENGGNATEFPEERSPSLTATDRHGVVKAFTSDMAVRRLTPLECERLQGFPDQYTDIPGASDSARYRALGNSMAVPVMRWIGQRIDAVQRGEDHD